MLPMELPIAEIDETCGKCRFWSTDTEATGCCRRYAPRPLTNGTPTETLWPVTDHDDWCGEHRPLNSMAPGTPGGDSQG